MTTNIATAVMIISAPRRGCGRAGETLLIDTGVGGLSSQPAHYNRLRGSELAREASRGPRMRVGAGLLANSIASKLAPTKRAHGNPRIFSTAARYIRRNARPRPASL